MSLTIGSFAIPGTFNLLPGPWEYQRQPNSVFGVSGETVLTGLLTRRPLVADAWIFSTGNYLVVSSLLSFLDSLDAEAGVIDTLTETNAWIGTRMYSNVEFQRFEPVRGPIWSDPLNSWLMIGRLHFLQIQPP